MKGRGILGYILHNSWANLKGLVRKEVKKRGNKAMQRLQNLKCSRIFLATHTEAAWGRASPLIHTSTGSYFYS